GAASRPPNIVFVLLDDLGYGDLGCYGQEHIQTPNIDRAAAEGLRFTDCYAGGTVCAPSRSVLMTGLDTGHTPIRANAGTAPLAAGDVTVAQVLKQAGYATGGFGKWGLGDVGSTGVPGQHGFDEFFGYLHQIHAHTYYPEFLWDNERKYPLPGNRGGKREQYSADLIAERSFEFIRKHKERPFFLYACYTLPHARFEIPSVTPYESKPWTQGRKTYAAMVTRADTHVGRIMALLKELALERETLLLITSDNGAHKGEEKGFEFFRSNGILRGQKGELYEGGIRVPMIACWPGRVKAGVVSRHPWAFCDFMPTAAELAGARLPGPVDGVSVAPLLTGGRQPERELLYWEDNVFDRKTSGLRADRLGQAVRMGDWKAVRPAPGAPLELYDLRKDPGEANDMAAPNPSVVARVEKHLKTARTEPRPHTGGSFEYAR
ncbi:MAG: arylsulfatase, partial [Gemmatimonadetes bacterium]|nr:arylsulfatase [Gemmatimonadota bacterium]